MLYAAPMPGGSSAAAASVWGEWWLGESAMVASITLGALTLAATATLTSTATATITLGALTLTATGGEPSLPEAAPDLTWQASYHYGVTVAPAYTSRITVAAAARTRTEG